MWYIIIKVIWMCSISHTNHLMVLHTAFFILGWHEMKQYQYDEMGWCKLYAFGHFVRVTWTQVLWAWQLLRYSRVGNAYSVDTLNKRMAHGVWQREISIRLLRSTCCVGFICRTFSLEAMVDNSSLEQKWNHRPSGSTLCTQSNEEGTRRS